MMIDSFKIFKIEKLKLKRRQTIIDMDFEFKKQVCYEFLEIYAIQIKRNLKIILEKLSKNKIDVSLLVFYVDFIL